MNFTESPAYFKVFNASAGSGKTFILVKNYLKILIESEPKIFQSILAITFTNKAAAEMKERVLSNLRKMALGIPSDIGEIAARVEPVDGGIHPGGHLHSQRRRRQRQRQQRGDPFDSTSAHGSIVNWVRDV